MHSLRATLNYLAPMSEPPVFCGPDSPVTNLKYDCRTVEIRNARTLPAPASLEREGFALVEHSSTVHDFRDRDELDGRYGRELAELIERLTGAADVRVVPGSTGRLADRRDESAARRTLPAAHQVHWDYTELTARTVFLPQIARLMGTDADAALRRFRRVTLYQTWRALSGPDQDVPLALVDGRTVRPDDLATCALSAGSDGTDDPQAGNARYADGKLSQFSLGRYRPEHRWYYFPRMRPDELLVFKGYEYHAPRQQPVLHTAFDDPTAPPSTPPRRSVEVRLFAFFE